MTIHKFSDTSTPAWPEVLESARVLMVYKHSPACMTSSVTQSEVLAFSKAHHSIPIYQVDVIHDRRLAHQIAAGLQVRHESPQLLIIHDGRAVWHTSHFAIKAGTLAAQVHRIQHQDEAGAAESVSR